MLLVYFESFLFKEFMTSITLDLGFVSLHVGLQSFLSTKLFRANDTDFYGSIMVFSNMLLHSSMTTKLFPTKITDSRCLCLCLCLSFLFLLHLNIIIVLVTFLILPITRKKRLSHWSWRVKHLCHVGQSSWPDLSRSWLQSWKLCYWGFQPIRPNCRTDSDSVNIFLWQPMLLISPRCS